MTRHEKKRYALSAKERAVLRRIRDTLRDRWDEAELAWEELRVFERIELARDVERALGRLHYWTGTWAEYLFAAACRAEALRRHREKT